MCRPSWLPGYSFLRAQLHSRWARIGLVTLGLAIVSANLGLDYRYHRLLAETGGRGIWSDAIYDLTGYLQQRCPTQRCFIGDWGLGTQVLTLAGGQLAIEEMFWPYINTPASPPQQQRQEHQLLQLLQPLGPAAAPLFVFLHRSICELLPTQAAGVHNRQKGRTRAAGRAGVQATGMGYR